MTQAFDSLAETVGVSSLDRPSPSGPGVVQCSSDFVEGSSPTRTDKRPLGSLQQRRIVCAVGVPDATLELRLLGQLLGGVVTDELVDGVTLGTPTLYHGCVDQGFKLLWGRVGDLVGLINALKLEKPILMGHSMGAGTVGWTVSQHPDIARAAILEDPGLHRWNRPQISEEDMKTRAVKARAEIMERKAMTREQLMELAKTKVHPGWSDEEYENWADSKRQLSPNVLSSFGGFGRS